MINATEGDIDAVRHFNRYYTYQTGLLNEGILKSPYSLTEARILFELDSEDALTASDLVRNLAVDAGYLSRILRKFEKAGIVSRSVTNHDRRQSHLTLTELGKSIFQVLDRDSRAEIEKLLTPLNPVDRARLISAMTTIEGILAPGAASRPPFVLRQHRPGDMGWVVHRHAVLYAAEYGWDGRFEALVADITAKFIENFDPIKERCWIAEQHGEIVGSIFLVKQSDEVATLRLLYVEPRARGLGLGRALIDEFLRFARSVGYRSVALWTNDNLHAARHIYEKEGFRLVREEAHHSFGKDLIGQNWERDL